MKFCWATINVSDMERSLAFYQNVAGLKLNRRMEPNPEMKLAFLGEGDTQLELIFNKNTAEIDFGKNISLGFIVESLSGFSKELEAKSTSVHSGPFQPNPHIRFLYVLDPDGLKIQFVENIPH